MPRKLFRKHTGPGTKYPRKKPRKPEPQLAPDADGEATVKVARAWLADAGFHEDPTGKDGYRIVISGPDYDGVSQEHYVTVRVYVPQIDIEAQLDEDRAEPK